MEVVKITKLIKISDFIVIQKKLTLTILKNAVANVLGNSTKISISGSPIHQTTLTKHLIMCGQFTVA